MNLFSQTAAPLSRWAFPRRFFFGLQKHASAELSAQSLRTEATIDETESNDQSILNIVEASSSSSTSRGRRGVSVSFAKEEHFTFYDNPWIIIRDSHPRLSSNNNNNNNNESYIMGKPQEQSASPTPLARNEVSQRSLWYSKADIRAAKREIHVEAKVQAWHHDDWTSPIRQAYQIFAEADENPNTYCCEENNDGNVKVNDDELPPAQAQLLEDVLAWAPALPAAELIGLEKWCMPAMQRAKFIQRKLHWACIRQFQEQKEQDGQEQQKGEAVECVTKVDASFDSSSDSSASSSSILPSELHQQRAAAIRRACIKASRSSRCLATFVGHVIAATEAVDQRECSNDNDQHRNTIYVTMQSSSESEQLEI